MTLSTLNIRKPIISDFPSRKCLTWIFQVKMCQFGLHRIFALGVKWQLTAYTLHCTPTPPPTFYSSSISSPFLQLLQYQLDASSG